ncbi:MAG: tRNA (adenosine(37)-N6)-dimethylallyltransferase MiaA, partial [Phycisphaerae bacterium]
MAPSVPILVITGQTATGKERLAVAVAERLGGEILSADSMKVYRGMDIGTAKAPPDVRRKAPHHLVDVADPAETFSTARWVELADAAVADASARGRVAIVSGGTALYLK